MDAWQSLVNVAAIVAGVAVLAGLIVRGRVQRAYFFALFLALTSAYGLVVALRPTLIVWRAWLLKELLLGLVTMLAAIEIGLQLFAARAGARPRAGRAVLVVMAATAVFLSLLGHRAHLLRHRHAGAAQHREQQGNPDGLASSCIHCTSPWRRVLGTNIVYYWPR